MRDGKALQAATSHYLGQGFPRTYDVRYTDRDGVDRHPYATSWGASTRLVGGIVMTHGDDRGLRLPPRLAPHQVVIVPIAREDDRAGVLGAAAAAADDLRATGVRVRVDDRPEHRPGFKFNEWELKGVPVRVEVGPRDLDAGTVTVLRRDTLDKSTESLDRLDRVVPSLLVDIQRSLREQAVAFTQQHTIEPTSYDEMRSFLEASGGFAGAPWCADPACEARVKQETAATIRFLPLDPVEVRGACIVCGRPAADLATWARAY
jgi:prolyl-tRNA synthetase